MGTRATDTPMPRSSSAVPSSVASHHVISRRSPSSFSAAISAAAANVFSPMSECADSATMRSRTWARDCSSMRGYVPEGSLHSICSVRLTAAKQRFQSMAESIRSVESA